MRLVTAENKPSIEAFFRTLMIRANALDRLFNSPPREEENSGARSGPIICVYNQHGEFELGNTAYVDAAGLKSADEARELVRIGQLYETIYDSETIDEIHTALQHDLANYGGYVNRTFRMNRTGRLLKWNTFQERFIGGTVRTAEDVTEVEISRIPKGARFEESPIETIPMGFHHRVALLRKALADRARGILAKHDLQEDLARLERYASIADVIVDNGPFLVTIVENGRFTVINKRYIEATGYTLSELNEMMQNKTLVKKLYPGPEGEVVKEYVENVLPKQGHYHDMFSMRNKQGDYINASWDTFYVDADVNVRIGSTAEPDLFQFT